MYYHLIFRHPFEKTQLTVHKNMGCTLLNDYHHLTWSPFDLFFQEICTFLLYTYLSRHILIMMKPYLDAKFPGKSLCGTFSTIWCYEWWMVYGKWWQEFEKRTTYYHYYYSIVAYSCKMSYIFLKSAQQWIVAIFWTQHILYLGLGFFKFSSSTPLFSWF